MRPVEREGNKRQFFYVTVVDPCLSQGQRGGCDMAKTSNAAKPLSSICLILWWLSTMKRRTPFGRGKGENDGSDPPQNRGVMRPKVDARWGVPLLSAPWGRSRPHLSLREGLEKNPFPLALHLSRSVLAVKGSLRRFAPWTAPGRSERRAAYEGKGGVCAVGSEGEWPNPLAHDKGYYHSCLGRSRKPAFGHTRRLSRSRGALSPAGP